MKPVKEYEKIIFIHGVEGEKIDLEALQYDVAAILGVSSSKVIIFEYESLMDKSKASKFNQFLAFLGSMTMKATVGVGAFGVTENIADRISDVQIYLNPMMQRTRELIQSKLRQLLLETEGNSLVIGFSLGSVVAREAIEGYEDKFDLLTIGSPMGMTAVRKLMQFTPGYQIPNWDNVYSVFDPIGMKKIDERLGILPDKQFKVNAIHTHRQYLKKFLRLENVRRTLTSPAEERPAS